MKIKIRFAENSDAGHLALLSNQLGYSSKSSAFKSRLKQILKLKNHAIYVAENKGKGLAGFIHIMPRATLISGNWGEIGALIIREKYRNQGIGKKLVKKAESWAERNRLEGLAVRSNTKREIAHLFYPKLGYEFRKTQAVYSKKRHEF